MKIRALAVGALALLVPLAAACSDDPDTSKSGIAESLQEAGLSKEMADCYAGELKDVFSEDELKALATSDADAVGDLSESDRQKFMEAATTCVEAGVE